MIDMSTGKSELLIPPDLSEAISIDPLVESVWQGLTPLARRDFILWIDSARQAETRKKRIERVPSMLKSGKRRPCCYTIVPANFYKALSANPKAKAKWSDLPPGERRDLVSWIDSAKEPKAHKQRALDACSMLTDGKGLPK